MTKSPFENVQVGDVVYLELGRKRYGHRVQTSVIKVDPEKRAFYLAAFGQAMYAYNYEGRRYDNSRLHEQVLWPTLELDADYQSDQERSEHRKWRGAIIRMIDTMDLQMLKHTAAIIDAVIKDGI